MRSKLLEWGVYGDRLEQILADLISERFLDEERFARSFARGRFRIKQWGRQRITSELKQRQVSAYCIRKAMTEIPEEEYLPALRDLLQNYLAASREEDAYQRRQKAAAYAMRRGWESAHIWEILRELEDF